VVRAAIVGALILGCGPGGPASSGQTGSNTPAKSRSADGGDAAALFVTADTSFYDWSSAPPPSLRPHDQDEILFASQDDAWPYTEYVALQMDGDPVVLRKPQVRLPYIVCGKDPRAEGSAVYLEAGLIEEPWDPTTLTGAYVPQVQSWHPPIAITQVLSAQSESAYDGVLRLPIGEAAAAWSSGTANHGLLLRLTTHPVGTYCQFTSLESADGRHPSVGGKRTVKLLLPLLLRDENLE
jgi:hypothetical protein